MKIRNKVLFSILALFVFPITSMATGAAPPKWQSEIISLISHQKYKEAGEKMKEYCVEKKNGDLCLTLASAYFEGEAKFGINSRDIIEAYRYTKLACDHGAEAGCEAYKAAIEKGELLQYVLFEPGVENRVAQLKEAIKLGADLNATIMFTATLLQKAINDENHEAVQLLLDNGVDVNYRVSDEDLTPLMYAVNSGNKEMVTLLLDRGADSTQTFKVADYLKLDKKEANACDLAGKLENREMMDLLKCTNAAVTKE
jgi:TPR repeat protein